MRLFFRRPIHLSYCTNMHPGETWAETFANLKNHTLKIRDLVSPKAPFGIGLRLSNEASIELLEPAKLQEFKKFLAENRLYVFTINGFPYGQFHGTKIKEKVFAPDWLQPKRLEYTNRLADILVELLPEGEEGSISTLPVSFEEWITIREDVRAAVEHLADCALHLSEIRRKTKKLIHLGLEPEPMGFIENIEETINFFAEDLLYYGLPRLKHRGGLDEEKAREILKEHLGICYDTCHMAIEYEDAAKAIADLRGAGIRISKVQVSSALRLVPSKEALRELERFSDGVYLHQVIGLMPDGTLYQWKDIPEFLGQGLSAELDDHVSIEDLKELRVHCHVPLYMKEHWGLSSTSDHITDLLEALRGQNEVAHFEIETYTWDVLPEELRRENLDEAVADEFDWFQRRLESAKD